MSEPFTPPSEILYSLLQSLRHTPPRLIQSPPTQPRRASVALILRLKPADELVFEGHEPEGWLGEVIPKDDWGLGLTVDDFFKLPWVNHPDTTPELLFIRRSPSTSSTSHHSVNTTPSRWSSHIAFPGGRHEQSDESVLYTALRETWEEIGIDLAERDFVQIGRLDEREITTSLGKRLLMILSPFVFLQTSPITPTPEIQPTEVSSVHWIPLELLAPPFTPTQWSHIDIDISTRLSPRNKLVRLALRGLVGKMQFGCVLLPDEPAYVAEGFDQNQEFVEPAEGGSGSWYNHAEGKRMLRLWGLSLGMTLDLLAHLPSDTPTPLILTSKPSSPILRSRSASLGPRTPVTVNSSFDDKWDTAAIESVQAENGINGSAKPGSNRSSGTSPEIGGKINGVTVGGINGAGLSSRGNLGGNIGIQGGMKGRRRGVGPGLTSVFPRFSYPDVNFWIWVFGRRYRQVVRGWEASVRGPSKASDRRTNWSGAAMSTFYSAVRQALLVAIILRALATGIGLAGLGWLLFKRFGGNGIQGEL